MRLHPYIYVFTILMACTAMACKSDSQTQAHNALDTDVPAIETFKKVKDITLEELESNVAQELSEIEIEKTERTESADLSNQQEGISEVAPAQEQEKTVPKKKRKKKTAKTKVSTKPKVKSYAEVTFEEMSYDFGEITEGDIYEHKFKFTNTGKAPLSITSAKGSCGCTHPSFPFIDVMPGESNEIGVKYHSVNKDGNQIIEVTVEANTKPKVYKLNLTGKVIPKEKEEIAEEVAEETAEEAADEVAVPSTVDSVDISPSTKSPVKVKKGKGTVISVPSGGQN